ncbi:MAG TPA: TlpA disulfide reductase family protein [Aeromicrobium sp.]|nr:TlpA disulfide reductase family protein [Aeromicrobium sp.]
MRLAHTLTSSLCVALLMSGCSDADGDRTDGDGAGDQATASAAPTPKPPGDLPDLCPPRGDPVAGGPKALPDLTLRCLGSDATRDLRRLAGRPTVINFWASWCGPCKVELPLLARAHREWGEEVAFLGIDVQDASAAAWTSITTAGVEYPQLEDPDGRTRTAFGWHSGLPLTVFVDARGRMVGTERTAFRTYPEVTAALRRHVQPERRANP